MVIDLLAKEDVLGRKVNFGGSEGYQGMQSVGDHSIHYMGLDVLPYGISYFAS